MEFEWDPKKNKKNFAKHGVSFEQAETAFADVFAFNVPDEDHSTLEEERQILIGCTSDGKVVLVVHVEIIEGELIRIVHARKAEEDDEIEYWRRRA